MITVSYNFGKENQLEKDWFDDSANFQDLFPDEIIRSPQWAFALCPLKDGLRLKTHALPTQILALDFDDPECSFEGIKTHFGDYEYVLYTTRNHQKQKGEKAPCDRFRIVLPLDKPLDPLALPAIVDSYGESLGCDTSCKDGARFFYFGNETSLIFRNEGRNLETSYLLSLAPSQDAQEAPTTSAKDSPTLTTPKGKSLVLSAKKPHSKHVSFLRKAWPCCQKADNTYENVFALMLLWIQEYGFDLEALKAALPQVPEVKAWYDRKPHQWQAVDATLQKALAYVVGNSRNTIRHRNTVEEINPDTVELSPYLMEIADMASGVTNQECYDLEDTTKLIGHVFNSESKAILDIQCGCGKSIVASAFVARSRDKWLIVRDTNAACMGQRELLLGYGVASTDIQVLSGWNAESCQKSLDACFQKYPKARARMKAEFADKAYSQIEKGFTPFYAWKDSPCETCWAACDFKASRTPRKVWGTLKHKRVVIMTHARFLELVHFAKKALEGFRILIDEEPALFEGVVFESKDVELLLHTFKDCLGGKVESHLRGLIADTKTGSIADKTSYSLKEMKTLQGRAARLGQDDKEKAYKYIHFFGYETQRFGFVESDNFTKENGLKKLSFVRNRLNWDLPNDTYVLNASSRFGLAVWEGFTAFRSSTQMEALGVTVYGYPCNSTKHRVENDIAEILKYAMAIIKTNGRKRVMLATNKEDNQGPNVRQAVKWFKGECGKHGVEVMEGQRGSIIGRNDWRLCDCVVMAYGVFTSVSNVTLKQSLVEGQEVSGERVWDTHNVKGKEVRQPRMRKGMIDKPCRETDRRMYADEVYQTGLRGVARNWRGDSQDVILTAPSMDYLLPITQALPGCKILFGDLDINGIETKDLLKPDSALARFFGSKAKDKETEKAARLLAGEILASRV